MKKEPLIPSDIQFIPVTWQQQLAKLLWELTRLAALAADQLEAENKKRKG